MGNVTKRRPVRCRGEHDLPLAKAGRGAPAEGPAAFGARQPHAAGRSGASLARSAAEARRAAARDTAARASRAGGGAAPAAAEGALWAAAGGVGASAGGRATGGPPGCGSRADSGKC